ncbi:hypothetical protein K505DRAFT_415654 [Melanomma pulvis-pyrius CBS 109.77]|uniref:Uncharacterized protein n=1 Tax=Melanomma pulvis-pyrius CBS 109.77 TaxID=1314802 RepID=A0A6A6XL28_9PLEO|nr:hypothetical protein K505DRAFT_415654 [Melanomma pulvis-pyrius CBS 109.77]
MNFVQNILWNSVEGFVEAGTRTAGGYAGDVLLKAGDLIENSGRSVGNGIERTASGYGSKISGGAPAPTVAKNPAIKRSHSSPASTKAPVRKPTSKTPLGANKYPGGKQITSGAKSNVGGAQKAIGGAGTAHGGTKKAAAKTNPLPKAYPNNVPYGTSVKPSAVTAGKSKSAALPKPNSNTGNSTTEKKTAVRPGGAIKPFNPSGGASKVGGGDEKKPYPGTNTLPGQASKTPVRAQKYKPMERLKPQVEKGKMQHFAV